MPDDKKIEPTPFKEPDPIENADPNGETPNFTELKNRTPAVELKDGETGFDPTTIGDVIPAPEAAAEPTKDEPTKDEPAPTLDEAKAVPVADLTDAQKEVIKSNAESLSDEEKETYKEVLTPPEPKPTEPPTPPAPVAPATEPETPVAPVTPTTPQLPKELEDEGKTFDETLRDPNWRPADWLARREEEKRFEAWEQKTQENVVSVEASQINARWNDEMGELRKPNNRYGVTIPSPVDPNNKEDPGVVARREIFAIAIELGDENRGTILPLPKAARVWEDRQKIKGLTKPTPVQPAGGDAPIAHGGGEATKVTRPKYTQIHGKSLDTLADEAMGE